MLIFGEGSMNKNEKLKETIYIPGVVQKNGHHLVILTLVLRGSNVAHFSALR